MPPAIGQGHESVLLVVDMQRIVLEPTDWHIREARDILPRVAELTAAFGPATVLTRHVPPADGGVGAWRPFYERWHSLLADRRLLGIPQELVPAGARIIDKSVYSAFVPELRTILEARGTLVVCGVETDCCVQATVWDAVDAGLPVTVVEDAVASPSHEGHAGALAGWRRLPEQVSLVSTAHLVATRR